MEFGAYIDLLYIKGYFKTKPGFVIKMLKSSVQNPNQVSVTDSALKGYIYGDPIHSLARTLLDCGLCAEKISAFIEGLYNTEHRRTPTYQKRYHGQTYKEALYDKIKKNHEVSMDEMADFLAKQFIEIINTAVKESEVRPESKSTIKCGSATLEKLRELILQMICLSGRLDQDRQCIAEWLKRKPISTPYSACPQWKPFHDAFEELQKCNAELKAISGIVKWKFLSSTAAMGEKLHAQSVALSCHRKYRDHQSAKEQFDCYREKLNEIMAQLEKQFRGRTVL